MSSRPDASSPMFPSDGSSAQLEANIQRIAAGFNYPTTPDLAAVERQRLIMQGRLPAQRRPSRLAFGLAILFIVLAAALMVSPARARVLDWIRIGAVRIFLAAPTATPTPASVPLLAPQTTPQAVPLDTPSPVPTPTFLESALDLAGETSFEQAEERADFRIQLPAFPPDLGRPDHVYLQQFGSPVVVMVWMNSDQPDQVRLVLSETASEHSIFEKYDPKSVVDTQVNGQPAVWVEGDYLLVMRNEDASFYRLIRQGHTLIWASGEMTYRLETGEDLETAVRMAESIR